MKKIPVIGLLTVLEWIINNLMEKSEERRPLRRPRRRWEGNIKMRSGLN
jgi:hypothetical protein